ncbi:putative sodium-coupled neutral amino acid transporter 11 [Halotydeus destructor]|nr:putative sodium-coupled neutral amino acid transporter 11 [Halotydeus destructor]
MAANESTYILSDTTGPNSGADSAFTISKNDQGASETLDTKQLIIERDSRLGPTSNLKQTGFNYVNSIIGSGVIGIPYALHRAGFGLGIVLLLVIAVLTDYSLCILVKAGNIAGVTTYQDVVEAAFGRTGFYLLTVIQFIYPFIAMISYNVIIGDTATKVFIRLFDVTSDNVFMNRNTVVFASTLFITLPLSLQKNMARLNKAS